MSVPTVFVTGATGYIGGDALYLIHSRHPTWNYRFLVRSEARGAPLVAAMPNSTLVVGSLTDLSLLSAEASRATIVLNFASSDDVACAQALTDGLASRPSSAPTAYLIHISGTGSLLHDHVNKAPLGALHHRIWDDVADATELTTGLPEGTIHCDVDSVVLTLGGRGAAALPNVKTAVVTPPCIVGTGRGAVNQRSMQVPIMIDVTRTRGRGFVVGEGRARWAAIHVHDLSGVFLLLAEDAARGGRDDKTWGPEAYYFAENGEIEWGAAARRATGKLHELRPLEVKSVEMDELQRDAVLEVLPFGITMLGGNARCTATRAREVLGWKPVRKDWDALVDEAVVYELQHAAQSRLADFAQGHMPVFPTHLLH